MAIKAERIAEEFDATLFDSNLALLIIRGRFTDETYPSVFERRFPRTFSWVNECFHKPRQREIALHMLDELFKTYGVEGICDSRFYVDSYCRDIVASYINSGDTYSPTLLLDHIDNRWCLTSWGNFVESLDARLEDEEEGEEDS